MNTFDFGGWQIAYTRTGRGAPIVASTMRRMLAMLPDGAGGLWHRIGDAGYIDEQGRLWYCGRVSQRVATDDGPLFPLQVEPIFDRHPRVRRSGLVGARNEAGSVPVICVELTAEADRSEQDVVRRDLLALAASHPTTQRIHTFLFRRRVPVDPRHNSKINRPELAVWASRALARRRCA